MIKLTWLAWNLFNITPYWVRHDSALQWRHNERDGVSNHQPHDCLLNRLFRRRSKKTSKLRVTGLCAGNSPVTGEFPAQRTSNAENVSIWWRHHGLWWNVALILDWKKYAPCLNVLDELGGVFSDFASLWASWRSKSWTTRLFVQQLIQDHIKEDIETWFFNFLLMSVPVFATWGVGCQKLVSGTGTSNYMSQRLWDVITYTCSWYLLLTHSPSYDNHRSNSLCVLNMYTESPFINNIYRHKITKSSNDHFNCYLKKSSEGGKCDSTYKSSVSKCSLTDDEDKNIYKQRQGPNITSSHFM